MTIFLVLSNFKHDGILYAKDSFFEGDAGTFVSLVADGVLKKLRALQRSRKHNRSSQTKKQKKAKKK
jgi:hypothetical protein